MADIGKNFNVHISAGVHVGINESKMLEIYIRLVTV